MIQNTGLNVNEIQLNLDFCDIRERRKQKIFWKDIAELYGVTTNELRKFYQSNIRISHPNGREKPPKYDVKQILRWRLEGQIWDEISAELGVAIPTAYNFFKRQPEYDEYIQKKSQQIENPILTKKGVMSAIRVDKSFLCPVCGAKKKASNKYCSVECSRVKNVGKSKKKVYPPKCVICDQEIAEGERFCSENCQLFDKRRRQRGKVGNAIVNVLDTVIKNTESVDRGTKLLMDVALRKKRQEDT